MKALILVAVAGIFFSDGFAQSRKDIAGKVTNGSTAIRNADVINATTNIATVSGFDGRFSIEAAVNDSVIVFSKGYEPGKILLSHEDFDAPELIIRLNEKSIELDEVFVSGVKPVQMKFDQAAADQVKVEQDAAALRVQGVYDGRIENGANFVRLGKDVAKLAKKIFGSKGNDAPPREDFGFTRALGQVDRAFFLNVLKLLPDEIPVFIKFCQADNDSRKPRNVLELMDFLIVKREEFK